MKLKDKNICQYNANQSHDDRIRANSRNVVCTKYSVPEIMGNA
jgi:hypothetical protein